MKVERLTKLAKSLGKAGFDPTIVDGLMAPQEVPAKKRVRDRSRIEVWEGGSARLRNLHGKAVEKRVLKEQEQKERDARKEEQEEKRLQAAEAERALRAAFDRCKATCMCGEEPCKMKGYKECAVCGQIKRRVCTKRECKAAGVPLLLTYNGACDDGKGNDGEEGEEEDAHDDDEHEAPLMRE